MDHTIHIQDLVEDKIEVFSYLDVTLPGMWPTRGLFEIKVDRRAGSFVLCDHYGRPKIIKQSAILSCNEH